MMRISGILAVVGASALFGADAIGQSAGRVVGCYRADPALTYSASGERERGDTSWAVLQLSADSVARRPLMSRSRDALSSWRAEGKVLRVRVHDGLVGRDLELTETGDGWAGTATYLSDAIVVGRPPWRHPITLTRRDCAPPA